MVDPKHACKLGRWHMAADTAAAGAIRLVMSMGRWIGYSLLVTGAAGIVGLLSGLEAIAAARRVAGDAVELTVFRAGAHEPGGERVVLAEVAAVGVEVDAFESD